ncbi:MAG: LPXTG cell wall anchor domain-containing protein [Actinomycetota bacterium]
MSQLFRPVKLALTALIAFAAVLVVTPGTAQASLGVDVGFTFPLASYEVGTTGIPVTLTITNSNTSPQDTLTNTICRSSDANPPCLDAGSAPPADDKGINFIPSCGAFLGIPVTCGTPDAGVISLSSTGTGASTNSSCDGTSFDIVLSDATNGVYRISPALGAVLELDPGETCTVSFTADIDNVPLVDQDSGTPGQQTGQIADVLAYSGALDAYDSDSSNLTVTLATPELATQASPAIVLGGGTISDTAFVSSRVNPGTTGTVTFRLYGPDDATCDGGAIFESTVNISNTQTQVTSEAFTPTEIGTYRWIASYSGDRNNNAVAGACNDANESVVVDRGVSALSTVASADQLLGAGDLTDTATVATSATAVTGSVTFSLFGPDDTDCTGTAIFTSTVDLDTDADVNGTESVTSEGYTPTAPGTYRWIASYSGDANNQPATGECNDPNESVVVSPAEPVLVTDAGENRAIGSALSDTATVTGRVLPGDATLDFRLYGPNDDDCTNDPIFEQLAVPFGATVDDTVTSDEFTPTQLGTYRWVVTYSGDANNTGAVGVCGDPTETVDIVRAQPTITTEASGSVPVGVGQLFDVAVVSGRVDPQDGATVSFRLYGPNDADCSGTPVFEDLDVPYPVAGGEVRSASFTPTVAGTYRWVAFYSGDANNAPATGVCGDPAETVSVTVAPTDELPATGSSTGVLMSSGAASLLAGLAFLGLGRRRRIA